MKLNRFSPTGFYSSAVRNDFIRELAEREHRQVAYTAEPIGDHDRVFTPGPRGRTFYLTKGDLARAEEWMGEGFTAVMKTPDTTIVFVTDEKAREIRADQAACMGCLSACRFSNWATNELGSTGKKTDPRSYCIQKTLAGDHPRRRHRQPAHVRRPRGLSLRERSFLLEPLHPERSPAGRAPAHRRLTARDPSGAGDSGLRASLCRAHDPLGVRDSGPWCGARRVPPAPGLRDGSIVFPRAYPRGAVQERAGRGGRRQDKWALAAWAAAARSPRRRHGGRPALDPRNPTYPT